MGRIFYVHVTVHRNKFLFNKTNRRTNFPNIFRQETLNVSGSSSAHHQSFPLHVRHWYMSCSFDDICQYRMYSGKLLTMGRGTARNTLDFLEK
jgi:hypothetical protein